MRSLRYLAIIAGLSGAAATHAQLEWFITLGPGNVQNGIGQTVGTDYSQRLNGTNVLIDHQSTISQGPDGVSGTHLKNFSVWIKNTGTVAVSTAGAVAANTLVGIDSSNGSGMGRTFKLLYVGGQGRFADSPNGFGVWAPHPTICGPTFSWVSQGPGQNGAATNASTRPWGYYPTMFNTVGCLRSTQVKRCGCSTSRSGTTRLGTAGRPQPTRSSCRSSTPGRVIPTRPTCASRA